MTVRFTYALHVETGLIHVWPDKESRTRMIGHEPDCERDGWRILDPWNAGRTLSGPTGETRHMAVMVGAWAGLPLNEAADRYESWLNRVRRAAIEKWVDSLPMRESTQLHVKYLDRDGAGHPKEEEDA